MPRSKVLLTIGDFFPAGPSAHWPVVQRLRMPQRLIRAGGWWQIRYEGRALAIQVRFGSRPNQQLVSKLERVLASIRRSTPWVHPLRFQPLRGWKTGASGNFRYPHVVPRLLGSSAWIANVPYRDPATADPPKRTLTHLPRRGVVIWAVIEANVERSGKPIHLDIHEARHVPCCDAGRVAGGLDELSGDGPKHAYSVIVRIYYGAPPTATLRAKAQRGLDRLTLPAPR